MKDSPLNLSNDPFFGVLFSKKTAIWSWIAMLDSHFAEHCRKNTCWPDEKIHRTHA